MILDQVGLPSIEDHTGTADHEVKALFQRCLDDGILTAGYERVRKRSILYSCGQVDCRIYVLASGYVKTVTISYQGKECLLGLYGPGDIFGELAFVNESRIDSAIALTECIVRPLSRLSTSALPKDLTASLLELCLRRVAEQQMIITGLITTQCEHRLAATLLRLARKFGHREGGLLQLSSSLVTQQELSEMVGTTRSRVGYFLRCFHERGMISRGKGTLSLDEAQVESYLMADC